MRVNLMSRLAALAMISPAALAQSGSGADDQTAAPTQAETDVERSDSGPGGQGDTSEGTPQGGSLAEMDDAEMVGRTVVSSDGAQIGEVETVIETPDGQNMLVVTTTGLLGSESRVVAIDSSHAQFDAAEDEAVTLSLTQQEVKIGRAHVSTP